MGRHELYMQKANQYLNKINELGRKIKITDKYAFPDGQLMYQWIINNSQKLSYEYKNKIIPNETRMEEIMIFAEIEEKFHEFSKNIDIFKYENRVVEYYMKVSELGRNISDEDKINFTDGKDMYSWYTNEIKKLKYEYQNKIIPDEKRMQKILLFASIENLMFDIKKKQEKNKKIENLSSLREALDKLKKPDLAGVYRNYRYYNREFSDETNIEKYERRCEEYIELAEDLGRNVYPSDEEYFSDGKEMSKWYYEEYSKYIKENDKDINKLSNYRISARILFEKVINEVNKYNKKYRLMK